MNEVVCYDKALLVVCTIHKCTGYADLTMAVLSSIGFHFGTIVGMHGIHYKCIVLQNLWF